MTRLHTATATLRDEAAGHQAALRGSLEEGRESLAALTELVRTGHQELLDHESRAVDAHAQRDKAAEQRHQALLRLHQVGFHQVEATLNLHALLDVPGEMLPMRGWALSPDLMLVWVELVRTRRPTLVVECGSGASTVWTALALRRFDIPGRVVALEHLPDYGEQTRRRLAALGLEDLAEVRVAPLEEHDVEGASQPWYAAATWDDLSDIDLLLVDGPPGPTSHHARFPAMPLLGPRLAPDARVVVDDLIRVADRQVVERWQNLDPDLQVELVDVEKRAAILARGRCGSESDATTTEHGQGPDDHD